HLVRPHAPAPVGGEGYSQALAEAAEGELALTGSTNPFCMTGLFSTSTQASPVMPVAPSETAKAFYNLSDEAVKAIGYFAARYVTPGGKKVMLVRIPDYTPDDETWALG